MLTIPAGSQPGQQFRLRGKGMPQLKNPEKHGDLFAHLNVQLPEELSDEEQQLFQQLAKLQES
jgi:DnaJ-class molecular chaperone